MKINLLPALLIGLTMTAGCDRGPTNPPLENNALYALQLVGSRVTPGWARDVWVDGNTAFVADDEQGVTAWDVTRPESPTLTDTLLTNGGAEAVRYGHLTGLLMIRQNNTLGGVTMFDRQSKRDLYTLGGRGASGFSHYELGPDTLVFAEVEGDDGCQFMKFYKDADVDFEWSATQRGAYLPNRGFLRSVVLDSSYAYFAHSQYGVTIIQIDFTTFGQFPSTTLGNCDTPGLARDLVLNRDKTHLFVADHQSGLQIVDITDKANPRVVGSIKPEGVDDALKVKALGDTAFFIDQFRGLYAIDCSEPTKPKMIGFYSTPDPQGLDVREDKTIFLADLELGLLVLRFRP